jgi:hypothetical protein
MPNDRHPVRASDPVEVDTAAKHLVQRHHLAEVADQLAAGDRPQPP